MSGVTWKNERPSGPIQSFVFLDFEATGLFPRDRLNPLNNFPIPGDSRRDPSRTLANHCRMTSPSEAPHIVELCLMCTSRTQIQWRMNSKSDIDEIGSSGSLDNSDPRSLCIPCTVHTRQLNPNMSDASWKDYDKRRNNSNVLVYSREHLEEKNTFAFEWPGVKSFLEQVPKPACLIAHSGVRYDFRILYAELYRSGFLQSNPIPEEVFFLDSYLMFIDLEKGFHDELRMYIDEVDWSSLSQSVPTAPSLEGYATGEVQTIESNGGSAGGEKMNEHEADALSKHPSVDFHGNQRAHHCGSPQKPPPIGDRSKSEPHRGVKRRLLTDLTDDHPLHGIETSQWSHAKRKRLRSNFFRRRVTGEWSFDGHCAMKYFSEGNFKLTNMYTELTGRPYDAHYAQNDCEALLQVCLTYGEDFLKYADTKAAKFPF